MAASTLEAGCFGDGSFGHQHTRERCADAIRYVLIREAIAGNRLERGTLITDLESPMSDDASEEDSACAWLDEHAPLEGHWWGWQDGDFGLWPESEE